MINGTSHSIINSRQHLAVLYPAVVCWASLNLSVTDVHFHPWLCADSSSPQISVHLSALCFFLDIPPYLPFFFCCHSSFSWLYPFRSVSDGTCANFCLSLRIYPPPPLPQFILKLFLHCLFSTAVSRLAVYTQCLRTDCLFFLLPLLFFPLHLFFFCCRSRQAALQVSTVTCPLSPSCHSCIMSARLDGHCIHGCNCTTAAHVFYRKTCSLQG